MASAAKTSRKANFTAIGQAGRKTGIQIQDTGERTEDGFEKIDVFFSPTTAGGRTPARNGFDDDEDDGVFASPQRSAHRATSRTATSGSAMDLQSTSTAPDPLTLRNGSPSRQLLRAGSAQSPGPQRSSALLSSPQRLPPNRGSVDPFGRDRTRSASPPKRPDTARGVSPFKEAKSPYSVRSTALPPPRPNFAGQQRRELLLTREEPEPEDVGQPEDHSNRATPVETPPRKKAPPRLPTSEIPSSPVTPRPANKLKSGKLMSLGKLPVRVSSPPQSPEVIPEDDGNDSVEELTPRAKSLKKASLPPPKVPKAKKTVASKTIDSEDESQEVVQRKSTATSKAKEASPNISNASEYEYEDADEAAPQKKSSKTNESKPTKQTLRKGKSATAGVSVVEDASEEELDEPLPSKKVPKNKRSEKQANPQSRRGKSAPKPHKAASPQLQSEHEEEEEEEEERIPPPPKRAGGKKPQKPPVVEDISDGNSSEDAVLPVKKPTNKKNQRRTVPSVEEEAVSAPKLQRKSAATKTSKKQKETVTIEDSPEVEAVPAPKKQSRKQSAASKPIPIDDGTAAASDLEQLDVEQVAKASKTKSKSAAEHPAASSSSRGSKRSRQDEEATTDHETASQSKRAATAKATSAKSSSSKASKPAKNKRKVQEIEEADADEDVEAAELDPRQHAVPSPKRRKVPVKEKSKRPSVPAEEEPVDHAAPASQPIIRKEKPPAAVIPQEDLGKRRSHRSRVAPLAFWRNEKAVYELGGRRASIGTIAMPVMKEVIRVTEPEPKPKRKPTSRSKKKPEKKAAESEDEVDIEDLEEWEKEDGVFEGLIRVYPPNEEDPEMFISEDLALTAGRIETQWVPNGKFALCKTVSKNFIGSGIIDLPPGGEKRPKNSGKMHIIMYVVSGRLQVQIGENIFTMRKGGQISIPRGNTYALANPWDRHVRLFFVQAWDTAQL